MNRNRVLSVMMLVYGAASLLHFVHNAVFLGAYPNMPEWLTPPGVMAAWLGVAATGLLGYWAHRRGRRVTGLVLIATYAGLGFAGLDHYVVAPIEAHSVAMHATILAEVAAAAALLALTGWTAVAELRRRRRAS